MSSVALPPKRKSLQQQIDADHPLSLSHARPRRSGPASLFAASLLSKTDNILPTPATKEKPRLMRVKSAPFASALHGLEHDLWTTPFAPTAPSGESSVATVAAPVPSTSNEASVDLPWLSSLEDQALKATRRGCSGVWKSGEILDGAIDLEAASPPSSPPLDSSPPHGSPVLHESNVDVHSRRPSASLEQLSEAALPPAERPSIVQPSSVQPALGTWQRNDRCAPEFAATALGDAGIPMADSHPTGWGASSESYGGADPHAHSMGWGALSETYEVAGCLHSMANGAIAGYGMPAMPTEMFMAPAGFAPFLQPVGHGFAPAMMPSMPGSHAYPVHYPMEITAPMFVPAVGGYLPQGGYLPPLNPGMTWMPSSSPPSSLLCPAPAAQAPQYSHRAHTPPNTHTPTSTHTRSDRSAAANSDQGGRDGGRGPSKLPWGTLATLAMDSKGSRQLQAELPHLSKSQLARVRDELQAHLFSLAKSTFGNYLVSKLTAYEAMHEALRDAFRGRVVELLCHAQGSRVIQAFITALPAATTLDLIGELDDTDDGNVLECGLDTHGSWGICLAFQCTRAPFILRQVSAHVCELAIQQHGCRVVQSVLQAAADADMDLSTALDSIVRGGLVTLSLHRFANYAVQVACRRASLPQREVVVRTLLGELPTLSTSKHGSNVAEVAISVASDEELIELFDQIFGASASSALILQQFLDCQFANYVLQTLLRRIQSAERRFSALELVRRGTTDTNYGRSILAKFADEELA